jgi:hypothetical protein
MTDNDRRLYLRVRGYPYMLYIEHGSRQSYRSRSVSRRPAAAVAWPRTSGYRCDYCGSQFGDMSSWDWPPDCPTRQILATPPLRRTLVGLRRFAGGVQ